MESTFRLVLALGAGLLLASFYLWPVGQGTQGEQILTPATLLASEPGLEEDTAPESTPSMLDDSPLEADDDSLGPVPAADVDEFSLGFYTDLGLYMDEQGRSVIDLLEQDYAYMTVMVTDSEGRAVVGATPEFEINGSSVLLRPEDVGTRTETDASGALDFAVIGGAMGLDEVTVKIGDTSAQLAVNVISLRATGFPSPLEIEGGLPWSDLMAARITFTEEGMSVTFPDAVSTRAETVVKLSGFMMPLDPDIEQRHFLLTSNPPSCFFHIPGGPAGAVEVFAAEGIEASWNPVVIEGRLETLSAGEYGVIYRLQDARAIDP